KIESRLKVNLVLIPNQNIDTPHHHIERLRHDDPRLDDTKTSVDLITEPETEISWTPNKERETSVRPDALVKGITPSQPAPKPAPAVAPAAPAASAATSGLFARIIAWFRGASGDSTPAAETAASDSGSGRRNNARGATQKRDASRTD